MSVSHSARVLDLELKLVLSLCESIATPRALSVYIMIENQCWQELLDLKVNPDHYDDHSSFADDYLVTSILQKNPRLPTGIDRRQVAIEKFLAAESQCRLTNERLIQYIDSGIVPDLDIHRAIHYAREFIRGVLGPLTRSDLAFCERKMSFGPGATTSLSGVVTQGKKYSPRILDTTSRLVDFGLFCLPSGWRKSVLGFNRVQSSKLTTVPKNAKTDRVICIEPDLNIYVQKGIGALLREKLYRSGLDLSTQSNNQRLASLASTLNLCTIDLSAASDTVSRQLIWLLLPERWAELLHMARVDSTQLPDGSSVSLEKWSSMGNGYTFELETLLFYAVLHGVSKVTGTPGHRLAYGDDLICPLQDFELVRRTLEFLGFNVNREKTFGTGRFHESCGTDWFDGVNVRPIFLRSDHEDFTTICYIYANSLRRWAHHSHCGLSCDSRLLPAWLRCFTAVSHRDRHQIPEGFGDVGFISDFDRSVPTVSRKRNRREQPGRRVSDFVGATFLSIEAENFPRTLANHPYGWSGFEFTYRHIGSRQRVISVQGCLTAFLNGVASQFSLGRESLRGRYAPATTKTGHTLVWPNLGPWI